MPDDSIDYAVMKKATRAAYGARKMKLERCRFVAALYITSILEADGNHLEGDMLALGRRNSYFKAMRLAPGGAVRRR